MNKPDDDEVPAVEPLTGQMLIPSEWRCALPSHIQRLSVTPRMCNTFPNEARGAMVEEST